MMRFGLNFGLTQTLQLVISLHSFLQQKYVRYGMKTLQIWPLFCTRYKIVYFYATSKRDK